MNRFYAFLFITFIPCYYSEDSSCSNDAQNYYHCIYNQRSSDLWTPRRPYRDSEAVGKCLKDAGCDNSLDYKRGLFVDFIKLWQNVANKVWNEYINTPEKIKQCIRQIIITHTQARLTDCMQSLGGPSLSDYPEEMELPYCGLPMPTSKDEEHMKAGLFEKVDILHEINTCREVKGDDVAAKATQCIDAIRHTGAISSFCNTSDYCIKTNVSTTCASSVPKITSVLCQCAKNYRDQTIATIDKMYATGTVNLLKLFPVFLGLDLTPDVNAQMKKCYTDNGAKPISALNVVDNPILSGPMFTSIQPRPQGIQAVRVLAYAQLDVPDICDSCS